ncbi:Metalloproteases (zincins), catalytic [Glarea lozoyensis ATCC 20868]|uniref:Aminopeptidase n=1 Tax=Glarea lozoyensis (strain ATCC 20868 / MF5171) TaxID=1116229 RepID=S3D928_GLAL2|nr:Metalloproteases (zincins), catalytic [Glarea lozoyensis ATCC 20868]EPE34977.1 Metalloproteases (zincins), catalytic [Glarea lozoyensis ATCC 20868]
MPPSDVADREILPDNIKAINYDISIHDLEMGGAFGYQGTVNILSKIVKPSKDITLNTHEIKIHSAELLSGDKSFKSTGTSYDSAKQRATLAFADEIPVAENANLVIKFQGTINNDMAGFYRSKYKPTVAPAPSVAKDGEDHVMFSTQFESCDARRAFPCFDEPNLKATFDFEIELPDDQVALSNMPEKGTRKSKDGFKVVSFDRTPVMSTYLLTWAVGDFEYIEDFTKRKYKGKHLPVRVYTTRGLKSQAQYALDHAPQIIDYFSEIFDIEYPLPKSDLLAVHEFSHGAMEGWGLVTYRTTAVLFDEKTSDSKYKNRIAYVVAHELAHQWFGNLVTMDWWSELWLNEGFATWVGWLATDKIHPEWNVWSQFVSEGMQTAFTLDSLRSSHPIEVPVRDGLDVDQVFDAISYLKGSSTIRMLATHLGQETFLKGVSNYLKAHAYGNATTNDLWSALSEASGQDINSLIDPWVRKIGFPVLTVAEEPGQIGIKQSRYLSTGDVKPDEDTTTWWVPLGLQGKTGTKGTTSIALTQKEDTIRDIDDTFYKINKDNAGFYRVNYPPARLAKLGSQIDQLSTMDKIGLVGDAGALALSGQATTSGLLAFAEGLQSETDYLVWSQILDSLGTVKSIFSDNQEIHAGLQKFTLKLITPAVERIGIEQKPDDDFLTTRLRSLLVISAGLNGHEKIISEAKKRFELYTSGSDKSAINSNLRAAIFGIAMRLGDAPEYHALKKEWQTTLSVDGKEIALRAMGRLQSLDLLPDYLDFVFEEVATQDKHTAGMALAANPKTRAAFWQYIQDNFQAIYDSLSKNMVVLDRFLKTSLSKFDSREMEQEIAKFFEGKDNRGYDRTLGVIKDTILTRAAYKERDAEVVLEWLKANGYA